MSSSRKRKNVGRGGRNSWGSYTVTAVMFWRITKGLKGLSMKFYLVYYCRSLQIMKLADNHVVHDIIWLPTSPFLCREVEMYKGGTNTWRDWWKTGERKIGKLSYVTCAITCAAELRSETVYSSFLFDLFSSFINQQWLNNLHKKGVNPTFVGVLLPWRNIYLFYPGSYRYLLFRSLIVQRSTLYKEHAYKDIFDSLSFVLLTKQTHMEEPHFQYSERVLQVVLDYIIVLGIILKQDQEFCFHWEFPKLVFFCKSES